MCTQIQWITSNCIQPITEALYEQTQHAVSAVKNSAFWIDKKIDVITNSILPKPAADVATTMIRCLPFLAMRAMFFPGPLFWVGLGAIVVFELITTPANTPVTAGNVENGFALGGVIEGGQQIAHGIAATNLPIALLGVGNIIASCIMFLRTGFVNTACGTSQTQPEELTVGGDQAPYPPSVDESVVATTEPVAQ